VRVWNSESTTERFGYSAYSPAFLGGVYVAAGDINRDGRVEIFTAPGASGGPQIKVFSGTGVEQQSFLAYAVGFTGGVRIGAQDIDGDGLADIVTGAGPSGGPHLRIFRASNGSEINGFMALDVSFLCGVYVG
jgi:hypothetical protein